MRGRRRREAFVQGWLQARDYYGVLDIETDESHGAECQKTENRTYVCTCDPLAQEMHARIAWRETQR